MSREDNQDQAGKSRFQMIADMAMGALYVVFGCWILVVKKFGNFELTGTLAYCMIGLLLVYGGFRLYRGFSAYKASKNIGDGNNN